MYDNLAISLVSIVYPTSNLTSYNELSKTLKIAQM